MSEEPNKQYLSSRETIKKFLSVDLGEIGYKRNCIKGKLLG